MHTALQHRAQIERGRAGVRAAAAPSKHYCRVGQFLGLFFFALFVLLFLLSSVVLLGLVCKGSSLVRAAQVSTPGHRSQIDGSYENYDAFQFQRESR